MFADMTMLRKLMFLKAASGGNVVEDTATGNPVTFLTDLAKPLRQFKVNFLPVQSGSGDPSPSNVRNISGWTGVNVEHFDENLLTINRTSGQETQGITYTPIKQDNKTVAIAVKGTRTTNNPFFNLNYISYPGGGAGIAIQPGTYKIFGGTSEVRLQVFYNDSGGTERQAGYDEGTGATVTIPNDATASWCRLLTVVNTPVDTVIYPIILSADSSVSVYPVTWSDKGSVAGGYIDLISGEVWATWAGIKKKWSEGNNPTDMGEGITRKIFSMVDNLQTGQAKNLCNVAPYSASENANIHFYYSGSGATNRNARVFLPTETDGDTDIVIITNVSVPILVTTLTPEQITALVGNNTIWSDANGNVEVTFLKKG